MEEETLKWVMKRAECDLDSVFEELVKAVKRDVKEMNALPPDQRKKIKTECDTSGGGCLVKQKSEVDQLPIKVSVNGAAIRSVDFVKEAATGTKEAATGKYIGRIRIKRTFPEPADRIITIVWNTETLSYDLIFDDDESRALKAWQVSQEALLPLLFA